jgi:hypothetical protein
MADKNFNRLNGLDKAIYIIDESIEKLKKHSPSSRALVILDDVDDVNHVDALFPDIQSVVLYDSLILITYRDRALLRREGLEDTSIYKLNCLYIQYS